MTNEEHQLNEMVDAIQQVTAISETKGIIIAKREVVDIINTGLENKDSWHVILTKVIDWAKN
jgi:hypothetical protein